MTFFNIKDIRTCRSGTIPGVVINSMEMCPAFRWKLDWSCLEKKDFNHHRFLWIRYSGERNRLAFNFFYYL